MQAESCATKSHFLLKTNNEKTTKFKLKVKLLEIKFVL